MPAEEINSESVVLVSLHDRDAVLDCATGFVIGLDDSYVYVMTCAHVLSASDTSTDRIPVKVNGVGVKSWSSGQQDGIDLAVLQVPNLKAGPPLPLAVGKVAENKPYYYFGFSQLCGSEYLKERGEGKFGKVLHAIAPDHGHLMRYHKLKVSPKGPNFKKGHSGAPILFSGTNKVAAVARLKDTDGKEGYAIDIGEAAKIWRDVELPFNPFLKPAEKLAVSTNRPPLPPDAKPEAIANDDPQKGRWGGVSEKNGRKLRAQLKEQYSEWFMFDAIVESTDPSDPLQESYGPFVFHLHDSYPRSVIWVRKLKDDKTARLEEVISTGVYTLAVQIRDANKEWIGLEYDLKDLPGLNDKFKSR